MFEKKNKRDEALERARKLKKEQMQKALKANNIQMPEQERELVPYTSEYKSFMEEIKQKPETLYEKACFFAEKIFPIKPNQNTATTIENSIHAAYINATPKGVYSLAFLSTVVSLIAVTLSIALGIGMIFGIFGLLAVAGVFYYFYNYPEYQAKSMRMKMSSDSVLAILYMVIYMRASPNLEGAVKFASQYLNGPLAWDLRKLLWDIETGKYPSADFALIDYINRWKDKNREFSEALNLLRGSLVEEKRRETVYEETINVILNGTRERARHYAADLRMPMMLIYAMGVLLPVMGLILFPVIMIFISDTVKPSFVFFGYDVMLPIGLYFVVSYLLSSKPPTFSPPDISKAKNVPLMGKFEVGSKMIPILPISLAIAIPFIILGFVGIGDPVVYNSVNYSLLIILGITFSVVTYAFLDSYQKIKIRKDIETIEDEFATALFQLGNAVSGGLPLELAIEKARANLKEMRISKFFDIISLNMKKFGYTFDQALFDKKVGALWYYPSNLIQSIMQTLMQSSKKSINTAANSMVTISRYLKDVHEVKEEINEILGETVTSMKFLAMFLAPLVSGVTLTMAVIILRILTNLGSAMGNLTAASGDMNTYQTVMLLPWAMGSGGSLPITPSMFQLVIGIYMVETAVLLSIFLNGVMYGDDPVGVRQNIWMITMIAITIYILSWFLTYAMFGGPIEALLAIPT
ncbi:MAG: type II secretion system F family protein [Candidatus Aenigmarchaeota archaeon]|nr:type II secretion system F family protein [Candidatus Aenigmarchaeota archaeon]